MWPWSATTTTLITVDDDVNDNDNTLHSFINTSVSHNNTQDTGISRVTTRRITVEVDVIQDTLDSFINTYDSDVDSQGSDSDDDDELPSYREGIRRINTFPHIVSTSECIEADGNVTELKT